MIKTICFHSSGPRSQRQQSKPLLPALPGRHKERWSWNLSGVSWVCLAGSSRWDMSETPHPGGALEITRLDDKTTSTGSSQFEGVAALLWASPKWSSYLFFSPKEDHFCHLYLQSHSFGHYPDLVAVGKGMDVDLPVNRQLCFHAQLCM